MAIKRNGVYVIQKEINVLDILEELCEAIEKADAKKVGYVTLTHGTANDIRDFFLNMAECEENKEETKGTEQNPTSDTERRNIRKPYMYPLCLGNYCGDDTECLPCVNKYICKELTETQENVKNMVNGVVDKAMKKDGKKDE